MNKTKPHRWISAYQVHPDFIPDLQVEIPRKGQLIGDLLLSDHPPISAAWKQDVWNNIKIVSFDSIGQAAKILKSAALYWTPHPTNHFRRTTLIAEQLKTVSNEIITFPATKHPKRCGSFSLVDANTLIYSTDRWHPFPNGKIDFQENKSDPPSRAYLKLWEAFTLINQLPKKNDLCLDLGASPGGWTWVLLQLGGKVTAVDKADLSNNIKKHPRLTTLNSSAFSLSPGEFDMIDWLCCDVICYPKRLLTMVQKWLDSGKCRNMICTIKFQGKTDFDILREFQAIPGSQTVHLNHNKHELTWIYPNPLTLNHVL